MATSLVAKEEVEIQGVTLELRKELVWKDNTPGHIYEYRCHIDVRGRLTISAGCNEWRKGRQLGDDRTRNAFEHVRRYYDSSHYLEESVKEHIRKAMVAMEEAARIMWPEHFRD